MCGLFAKQGGPTLLLLFAAGGCTSLVGQTALSKLPGPPTDSALTMVSSDELPVPGVSASDPDSSAPPVAPRFPRWVGPLPPQGDFIEPGCVVWIELQKPREGKDGRSAPPPLVAAPHVVSEEGVIATRHGELFVVGLTPDQARLAVKINLARWYEPESIHCRVDRDVAYVVHQTPGGGRDILAVAWGRQTDGQSRTVADAIAMTDPIDRERIESLAIAHPKPDGSFRVEALSADAGMQSPLSPGDMVFLVLASATKK